VENLDLSCEGKRLLDMTHVCSPRQYRGDLNGYIEWLGPVPWQVWATLTFAWKVSDAQADRVFAAYVDRVERFLRCPLTYIRGDELRFSGCGKPASPRHYHVLFAAECRLDPRWLAAAWMALAGAGTNGAGAHVCQYDPNRNALAYTLKLVNRPDGDWSFKNLDLFIGVGNATERNHRARRRMSRHGRSCRRGETNNSLSIESSEARDLRKRSANACRSRKRQPSRPTNPHQLLYPLLRAGINIGGCDYQRACQIMAELCRYRRCKYGRVRTQARPNIVN
jgi:hypothetical protein